MNDELKNAGSPYSKLEKTIAEQTKKLDDQHAELLIHSIMLDRLCTLSETKIEGDKDFRNIWRNGKRKDFYFSVTFLTVAFTALYLDVIKFNPEGAIMTSLFKLFGSLL